MTPKFFPQLTDIIGLRVYGRENWLPECLSLALTACPDRGCTAPELLGDVPYGKTETALMLREAECKNDWFC